VSNNRIARFTYSLSLLSINQPKFRLFVPMIDLIYKMFRQNAALLTPNLANWDQVLWCPAKRPSGWSKDPIVDPILSVI